MLFILTMGVAIACLIGSLIYFGLVPFLLSSGNILLIGLGTLVFIAPIALCVWLILKGNKNVR